MSSLTRLVVARCLGEIADLLEIEGEESFKTRAYRRAARAVQDEPADIEVLAREGRLQEIPGVGANLAPKIEEIIERGTCRYLEKLRARVPRDLAELLRVPGVGARTVAMVHRRLGVSDVDALEEAARAGRLQELPGLGPRKEANVLRGIAEMRRRSDRMALGFALRIARELVALIERSGAAERIEITGSVRRFRETVGDIDLVAASRRPDTLARAFVGLPLVSSVIDRDEKGLRVELGVGGFAELWIVDPPQFAAALHYSTGSKAHFEALRRRAGRAGLEMSERGLLRGGEPLEMRSEEDIYAALGLPWIPPELREDRGEIEAAARGELPDLVTLEDVRGDLHVHTSWSDGSHGLEEMAEAARRLGYRYIAVCDHSRSLAVARGLSTERLREQIRKIRELNGRWDDFELLAGIEADVLNDGSLDLDDGLCGELDLVTASVHSGMRQPRQRITERILAAIDDPRVSILAHPTGRLLGEREPYDVDLDAVFERAALQGVALEINASPDRLDLNDENAKRAARDFGIPIAINTDAHSVTTLDDMEFGVGVARRAWLERRHVINTLETDRLEAALGRRAGGGA